MGILSRRSQIQISFGMIFSIMLVVIFIAFGIYVIYKFIIIGTCVNAGLFKDELQNDVDNAWTSESYRDILSLNAPSGLTQICFVNASESLDNSKYAQSLERYLNEKNNLYPYPPEKACSGQSSYKIEHLDIAKITETSNPYCVNVKNGKVALNLTKDYYDKLVSLK